MNDDVILVDEPRAARAPHHDEPAREAQQPHPPVARRDPRDAARARPGPRRVGHDHPRRGPVVLGRLRPRRRQRGPGDAVLHAGRRRRVAAPRHRRLDEHLGSRQAGDRAGARLLPRRRERARDRLRPRLHGRGRADGLPGGALRRARHALPPVVPRHAQGDGDDAHRRLDLRRRSGRARLGERGVPGRRARRARARGRASASRWCRSSCCSSTSASCTARWTRWDCAPASAPAPSCARSARTPTAMREFIGAAREKGLTTALQERDAPFGDYRTAGTD